jgi:hypothetical protein
MTAIVDDFAAIGKTLAPERPDLPALFEELKEIDRTGGDGYPGGDAALGARISEIINTLHDTQGDRSCRRRRANWLVGISLGKRRQLGLWRGDLSEHRGHRACPGRGGAAMSRLSPLQAEYIAAFSLSDPTRHWMMQYLEPQYRIPIRTAWQRVKIAAIFTATVAAFCGALLACRSRHPA